MCAIPTGLASRSSHGPGSLRDKHYPKICSLFCTPQSKNAEKTDRRYFTSGTAATRVAHSLSRDEGSECVTRPPGPYNDLCEACHAKLERGEVQHPPEDNLSAPLEPLRHTFKGVEAPYSIDTCRPWLSVVQPHAPSPNISDRFVVRPEFKLGSESYYGAYAFAVELPNRDRHYTHRASHF